MVDVEVVDSQGNRCPTALNMIQFKLAGEASWRGGIAQGPQNYILAKQLPVENGINRVLIRSGTKAGKITLVAVSGNLLPASVELESKPSSIVDGLSALVSSEDLPSHLKRGPTPAGESFKNQRRTLDIVAVSAGSNQNTAKLTFDDDETTSWSSDNGQEKSWIQYELAGVADVNQVVLKMVGHRTKSLSIKVSVGMNAVWKGRAGKNLGYATIRFEKRRGKSVRIEADGEGKLEIVELEIYGPLS
jgi:beta-galactosidase